MDYLETQHWEKKSTLFKSTLATLLFRIFCLTFIIISLSGCAFRRISRYKTIGYLNNHAKFEPAELNLFTPYKSKNLNNVQVFIHGGNWNSGKKSLGNFSGGHMARKNVVMIIIDYPLSPGADYHDRAIGSAQAVEWTEWNIKQYGGNPDNIFESSRSAGGHLAVLIALQNRYFDSLKMEGKTYRSVIHGNEEFIRRSNNYKGHVNVFVLNGKKTSSDDQAVFWPCNPRYKQIIMFMETEGSTPLSSLPRKSSGV